MRFMLALLVTLLALTPAHADDASTLTVSGAMYRLGGIDAPEVNQACLDDAGAVYPCGLAAAKALQGFISDRAVQCEDRGSDPSYPSRRIGICTVGGVDLHKWLVRSGWALSSEPQAQGRFNDDERYAREHGLGLWSGCFVRPIDFRHTNEDATWLGASCQRDAHTKIFRSPEEMPDGCEIKGKYAVRAGLTGHAGIYHVPGCGSYRRTHGVDRWFCSEQEAIAAGFRRSYTCWVR